MKKRALLSFILALTMIVCGIFSSVLTSYAADFAMTSETVSVSNAPNDASMIVAMYDENNALLGCKIYKGDDTIDGNYAEDLSEQLDKAASIKTFLWDMNTLKPLTDNSNDVLIVYFSRTGTTKALAQNIHSKAGGDIVEIIPKEPYSEVYSECTARAQVEINADARPEVLTRITNIDQYNTILVGYPIWGNTVPPVVRTFLDGYDLSGKTVMPFCTHGGSGISGSMTKMRELCPNSTVTIGLDSSTESSIDNWLVETGFNSRPTPTPVPTPTPLPEKIGNMFLINGGTFVMGSPTDEPERGADEIQHNVTVDSFYMAETELTQKEYQDVMGNNPSENKGDNLPVTNITWYDAIQYCNALSEKEGLTPCYTVSSDTVTWNKSVNGYRLPTEAEWEYAARANTSTPFSFGDYVHDEDANCYNAYGYNNDASGSWVNGYLQHTVSVDSYNANGFGLYNMHGNAAEWVWDWYDEYTENSAENPTGAESGNYKIARGGGWNDFPKHIRSAYRSAFPADVPLYSIGVRPVRNAEAGQGTVTSRTNTNQSGTANKTLIAYFSQTGNTDGLAKIIAETSGADIFRIERKTPYSSSHNGTALYGEALNELRSGDLPELKAYLEDEGLDINQYDTILLGYCNWWASIPAPVSSFLAHYDLSGKTIIPFCSMGGGRFGQGISMIAKLAPNSVIKEGLTVTYSSYDRNEIENWLKKNGIEKPTPTPTPTPEPNNTKALVAYFSATNNTEGIAKHILDAVDADEYEIIAETPYTSADLNYNTDCRANREQNDASARPAISGAVENMDDYDIVFLGYPIWWGQAPKIIYTFLESYDMSGKTIVPFCTSASSGVGSSATNLHSLCSDTVTWTAGRRFASNTSKSTVVSWINGLGLDITAK